MSAGKDLAEQAQLFATQFAPHFIDSLQNIRYGQFHGSEPYMFATMFGPSAFADSVRDLLQTGHTDQTRFFRFRSASLDRGWRGQNGVMLVEGTIVFDDEVGMSESHWYEPHSWTIRGLGQSGSPAPVTLRVAVDLGSVDLDEPDRLAAREHHGVTVGHVADDASARRGRRRHGRSEADSERCNDEETLRHSGVTPP